MFKSDSMINIFVFLLIWCANSFLYYLAEVKFHLFSHKPFLSNSAAHPFGFLAEENDDKMPFCMFLLVFLAWSLFHLVLSLSKWRKRNEDKNHNANAVQVHLLNFFWGRTTAGKEQNQKRTTVSFVLGHLSHHHPITAATASALKLIRKSLTISQKMTHFRWKTLKHGGRGWNHIDFFPLWWKIGTLRLKMTWNQGHLTAWRIFAVAKDVLQGDLSYSRGSSI